MLVQHSRVQEGKALCPQDGWGIGQAGLGRWGPVSGRERKLLRLRTGPPCPGDLAHRRLRRPWLRRATAAHPCAACARPPGHDVLREGWGRGFYQSKAREPGFPWSGACPAAFASPPVRSSGASPVLREQSSRNDRRHALKPIPGTKPQPQRAERRGSPGVWRKQHRDVLRSAVGDRTSEPADAPYPRTAAAPAEASPPRRPCSCGSCPFPLSSEKNQKKGPPKAALPTAAPKNAAQRASAISTPSRPWARVRASPPCDSLIRRRTSFCESA